MTDGPWDLHGFLHQECARKALYKALYFDQWINARWLFAAVFNCGRLTVTKQLKRLGLSFHGQQHSGLDDTRNIARIFTRVVKAAGKEGVAVELNDGVTFDMTVGWRGRDGLVALPCAPARNTVEEGWQQGLGGAIR